VQHLTAVDIIRSANGYSLPATIAPLVSFVDGMLRFPYLNTPIIIDEPRPVGEGDDQPFQACGATCAGYTSRSHLWRLEA
jgi:hypothetical protein